MDEGLQVSPERINLISKLGEGSFGQVWKGEIRGLDGKNGTSVAAVKTLKGECPIKDSTSISITMHARHKLAQIYRVLFPLVLNASHACL